MAVLYTTTYFLYIVFDIIEDFCRNEISLENPNIAMLPFNESLVKNLGQTFQALSRNF